MTSQIALADVMLAAMQSASAALRVSVPAKIVSFDSATQTATVQPLLKDSREIDGERVTLDLPLVEDVPVQFPGAGGYVVTFPVNAGTPCWLVVSDRAIDNWHKAPSNPVDPGIERTHDLTDCCAILGVRSSSAALSEFEASGARFGKVGGPGISVRTGSVHLGVEENESATEAAVWGTTLRAELQSLRDAFNAHLHVSAAPGSLTGTPMKTLVIPGGISLTAFDNILSSIVKVK